VTICSQKQALEFFEPPPIVERRTYPTILRGLKKCRSKFGFGKHIGLICLFEESNNRVALGAIACCPDHSGHVADSGDARIKMLPYLIAAETTQPINRNDQVGRG
jgi:hypothetical protein